MERIKQEILKAIQDNSKALSATFDPENPYAETSTKDDFVIFGNICAMEWMLCLLDTEAAP